MTRKPQTPRWVMLAELRDAWQSARHRFRASSVVGHYDDAVQEMRLSLKRLVETLKYVEVAPGAFGRQLYWKIEDSVRELEGYLRSLDQPQVNLRLLTEIQRYLEYGVVARYEELALGYVAWRRRLNGYRRRLWSRLRTGHVFPMEVLKLLFAIGVELIVGTRFCASALHHM